MERKQKTQIIKDLEKKMVFITGPRQSGKTWLAKNISANFKKPVYLNYDRAEDRKIIKNESWLNSTDILIFDELHKMKGWKNYLKGVFDTKPENMKIIVTGSARLATFKKGGDSLAGRFFSHTLLPFSPAELSGTGFEDDLERFMERSGFPEPFLAQDPSDAARWRKQYIDGLVRTDILDFEKIQDLRSIELVLELLRSRVGSPVSYSSIAEDAGISPNTVKKYIQILEALYIVFRVTPFTKNVARSLMKEPKIYFYDTGLVKGDAGAVFENFAALNILKSVVARSEAESVEWELKYLRTKEKKEVDFCIAHDGSMHHLIEAKYSGENAPSLIYFAKKFNVSATLLVFNLKRERSESGIEIRSAFSFFKELFL